MVDGLFPTCRLWYGEYDSVLVCHASCVVANPDTVAAATDSEEPRPCFIRSDQVNSELTQKSFTGTSSNVLVNKTVVLSTAVVYVKDSFEFHKLQKWCYVDDLLTGAKTERDAIQLASQLMQMMERGGLTLRKWCSNSPKLLRVIPEDLREDKSLIEFNCEKSVKVLGVNWQPGTDTFTINVNRSDALRSFKKGQCFPP
ncbi:hypothetical protein JTE90_023070 [Oedothorax gibbosus]|uniref:Reverse transcriptase domain-containing protein n=1 Tax=Oedothorax gibbosus TaxID=931172 RepID=A0AAV6UWL2_9ARAC|nr:hypothetical protein JTE90_023070 [Oedothorax gibbosus]